MPFTRPQPWLLGLAAAALLLGSAPAAAYAGGSKADYARAAALAKRVRGTVKGEQIDEAWLGDGALVFRRTAADGSWRFEHVALATGTKREAFDHRVVAQRLGAAQNTKLDPDRLALRAVGGTDAELFVQVAARVFGITLATSAVKAIPLEDVPALHLPADGARRSKGGGRDTAILFINRSSAPVHLVWLDHRGAGKKYGTLAPGERSRKHTYPGHVWRVETEAGKGLGAYTARSAPGVVVITGKAPAPGRTRKKTKKRPATAAVSPDGRTRVFLRGHNVFLRATASAKESRLSSDGSPTDRYTSRWMWSPSGRYLMVVQEKPAQQHDVHVVNSVPKDSFQPTHITYRYLKPGDRIAQARPRLFDIKKRTQITLPDALYDTPWSINKFSWSADGKRFRFLYNQRGHQVLRVVELDPAKRKVRVLIDETSSTFVDYSQKTFLHSLDKGERWLWMSERSGFNHLYRVDAKTGKTSPVTQGDWLVRRVLDVDEETKQIQFEAMGMFPGQDPYHVHVGRVGFDGKGLTWLTEGDGTHTLRFAPSGAHYIDTYSRVDLAPVHELRRTQDGSLVCELARAEIPALLATGWKPTQRFKAKGRDGTTDIWGVLHLPSDFDDTKRYPVIESIYAGPHGHFVPKSFRAWSQAKALAELGFVVVQIDGMGTNWRSRAFHDVCWKNLGDSGFPDRIAWIRAAAKTRPYLDLDHVGIYGGSAGGQSALRALLAHGAFYKAAVSDCGCHDNRMDKIWWNEAWMGWPIGPHYAEQSNVTQAHELTGKLLLIVGEIDRNVDPASTMKVVDALIKADKDFDLLVVPGKGHGAGGSTYGRRRRADFFVRHLLHVEPRAR